MGVRKSYWVMRLPKPFLTSSRTEQTAKMSHLQLLLLLKSNHRLKNTHKASKAQADGEQKNRGALQMLQSLPRISHRVSERQKSKRESVFGPLARRPWFLLWKKFQPSANFIQITARENPRQCRCAAQFIFKQQTLGIPPQCVSPKKLRAVEQRPR